MVYLCNSIAAASPKVTSEIIESDAFPDLVKRYKVGMTPTIVINDTVNVTEHQTPADLIAKIIAA